ncbi:MAG: ABC transporter ATP-binding protein, partial [Flavisolibacter sp.]|nr:ABC transporter ATP-binding protein [Flavisolibacter sp.]
SRPVEVKDIKKKISFKEQREYEVLEKELAGLEEERKSTTAQLSAENLAFEKLSALSEKILEINQKIEIKEMRWLQLSEMYF